MGACCAAKALSPTTVSSRSRCTSPKSASSRRATAPDAPAGDFVTSPEVGSLFGACVAVALDRSWHELDEPDPFVVIEAGAGNGRLARDVLRAEPACVHALHYVLVERSAPLREEQRERLKLEPADEALGPFARVAPGDAPTAVEGSGPVLVSLDELPRSSSPAW